MVGSIEDTGSVIDGLVGIVWDWRWEIYEDEYLSDEDTNGITLVYDMIILGSTWVFNGAEWDILYNRQAKWASVFRGDNVICNDNVWYDSV